MDRRRFGLFAGLAGIFTSAASAWGTDKTASRHRLVIQVSTDDPKVQGLALTNAGNYARHYRDQDEACEVEIVAFGPGFAMMRADMSAVPTHIDALLKAFPAIVLAACQNSRRAIAASEGKTVDQIPPLPGVTDTPAGIVRVAMLQEQGWSYARP